jgi:glutaredoxin
VVVYTMDKQRRELAQLVELLDAAEVPYRVLSLEDDPAGQAAVRRDSQGKRLPVVFIAGEVVGGRGELLTLGRAGLRARVYGAP